MADLIDRQKIKAKFEPWLKVAGYSEGELNMLKAVLYEIEVMPSAQPECDDTVSRKAEIDAIKRYIRGFDAIDVNFLDGLKTAIQIIEQLPHEYSNAQNTLQRVGSVECEDAVSRRAAINTLIREPQADGAYGYLDTKSIVDALERMPSAERHGEWIQKSTGGESFYTCSRCGFIAWEHENTNYCPNCGADMRGEEHEDIPMEYYENGGI